MPKSPRDPLLTAARILTGIAMGLAIFIGVLMLVLLPVMIFGQEEILKELGSKTGKALDWKTTAAIQSILVLIAIMAGMAYQWLRDLRRVIDSVGLGDPFVPENADRLAHMGWLTVSIELLAIPVGGIGQWLAATIKDATSDFGLSLGGILLALVLFILARVFREGAAMRSELEGTV